MNGAMLAIFALFVSVEVYKVHSQTESYVPCIDQQEACVCDEDASECRFRLEIEELQTFTSYCLTEGGKIITRGSPGDTYYLTPLGFQPSLNDSTCNVAQPPPECGGCRRSGGMPIPPTEEGLRLFRDELNCSIPMTVDGRTYRRFIAVNGRTPGPTLIVTEGQTVTVDVYNKLTSEGISVHWHGMHQRGTPWMDGVASLSHIPIVPGARFRYNFTASPAGTHWYHSHVGAQRTDGLYGAFVVREKSSRKREIEEALEVESLVDMPDKHTLSLLDWQRETSSSLFVQTHSNLGFYPNKPLGEVPQNTNDLYTPRTVSADNIELGPVPFFSGLINGRGRYDSQINTLLSVFTISNSATPYRFRLIGAQSQYAFRFEIDRHRLRVIATDGHFIQPVLVDYIIVHSGERYDFIPVLITGDETPRNYWMRARTLETSYWSGDTRQEHVAEGILHYDGAPLPNGTVYNDTVMEPLSTAECCNAENACTALNCPFKFPPEVNNDYRYIECIAMDQLSSLFPSDDSDLPRLDVDSEQLLFFNFGFKGQTSTSAINGRSFLPPVTPYQTYPGQYETDQDDDMRNTCEACNADVPPRDQAEVCTCIHVREIFTSPNRSPTDNNDKSVVMVFSAIGNLTVRNRNFAHPVHLHGHRFYIVRVGHGQYSNDNGSLTENTRDVFCDNDLCVNPSWQNEMAPEFLNGKVRASAVQKDTVLVPAGGYVVVAFKAENPGYWLLHCHIGVHLLEGMAVVIKAYSEDTFPSVPAGINDVGDFPSARVDRVRNAPIRVTLILPHVLFPFVMGFIILNVCICLRIKSRRQNRKYNVKMAEDLQLDLLPDKDQ